MMMTADGAGIVAMAIVMSVTLIGRQRRKGSSRERGA